MLPITIAFLMATFSFLFWYFYKLRFNFWNKLGIPSSPVSNFLLGHLPNPINKNNTALGITIEKEHYSYFKQQNRPYVGIYLIATPVFIPIDLDLIKRILIKDFDYFDQRGSYFNEERQPISAHLFNIGGKRWKNLRLKLTPTFTSGKMKLMLPSVIKCTEPLMQQLEDIAKSGSYLVNVKELCGKFTTDVIGSCAFGIQCNSFDNDNFKYFAHKAFNSRGGIGRAILQLFPGLAHFLGFVSFPLDVSDFFESVTRSNIKLRKSGGGENKRNDFIQLLIDLYEKGGITENEVLSSAFVFFIAGFETSATTLSYCLYELSLHQDVQDKVREEIRNGFKTNNGEMTYEALGALKYLQQVVDETLRLHPPLSIINRKSSKDYPIPGTNVTLPEGTIVFVPAKAIHYDPAYYPDPEKFDPERFSDENKNARHSCAFLAFGEGPRLCIGSRFAFMQIKVALCYLLREHRFTKSDKTPVPMVYDSAIILSPRDPIILNCEKI